MDGDPSPVQWDVVGAFIDSFENMPGDQPVDERRPTVTDLKRDPRDRPSDAGTPS